MTYYSRYSFKRNEEKPNEFIFLNHFGEDVKNFIPAVYKKGPNLGKSYIRITQPRSPKMRKYFDLVFELSNNKPLTSTEAFNKNMQTFGDSKSLGSADLILIEYNEEYKRLSLYFLKGLGWDVLSKKNYFARWAQGEELTFSPDGKQICTDDDEEVEDDEPGFDPYDEFQDELAEEDL